MYQHLHSSIKQLETLPLIMYNFTDAEKRKEMESMILNWEADSRPATAGAEE